VKDIGR